MNILITGLVATAVMDLWGLVRKPLLGWAVADYRFVGRWVSGFSRGQFRHEAIGRSQDRHGEVAIGWVAHYLLGLVFAALLLAIVGADWIRRPALMPAMLFGLITVLVPFLVMQPAMGAGYAASRTPRPTAARLQSLVTHAIFGLGLYAGGWAARFIQPTGV
ncbi:MAG TPA: DUF2938 domain-containing protein [Steroidobacteraceae bacterium]